MPPGPEQDSTPPMPPSDSGVPPVAGRESLEDRLRRLRDLVSAPPTRRSGGPRPGSRFASPATSPSPHALAPRPTTLPTLAEPVTLEPLSAFTETRRAFAELEVRLAELRGAVLGENGERAPVQAALRAPEPLPIRETAAEPVTASPPADPIAALHSPTLPLAAAPGSPALPLAAAPGSPTLPRRRTRKRAILAAALLMLLVIVGAGAFRMQQIALGSRERLAALQQSLAAQEPVPTAAQGAAPTQAATAAAPSAAVRQICTQAEELNRELGPVPELAGAAGPAAQFVARVPQVGDQAASRLALASAAGDTFAALRIACETIEPMLQAPVSGLDASQLVATLGAGRERLRTATGRLRSALAQLASIDERALDDSTRPVYVALRDRLPAVTTRLALLAELPGLLGYDGPRTFLVLGQNSDELRPSGGFIGTGGLMTFDKGKLARRQYGSSFNWDIPADRLVAPPAPLQQYMEAGYWQLKEANWWADFPSTAQQARYFYQQVGEEPVAGVIAIDQSIVELLLEVTGPISVPDYNETVDQRNVRARMEYYTHLLPSQNEQDRKGFVSALFPALIDRLNTLPRDRFRDLVAALDRSLREQHLQIWSEDDRAQQALADLGWDGRMLATNGDYLYSVSSNLSRNKINKEVEQELSYEVSAEPSGRLVGRASIALRNRRPTSDPGPYRTADLRDYLRLYVPPGSELLAASGFDDQATAGGECGRTVFSGLVTVSPGGEQWVQLTYRLPDTLRASDYSLLVQKQPGSKPSPVWVRGFGASEAVGGTLTSPGAFAATDGKLATTRWSPYSQGVSTGVACAVRTEPPKPLRPPAQIAIPKIGVQADFIDLGLDADGILESPKTGSVVAWYRDTARPGQVGNMIASGHVDWDRRAAVFWGLRELRPGDAIQVLGQDGVRYRYEVEWSRGFNAWNAPLDQILGPTTQRWLTLITCGGTFNQVTQQYDDRLIVRARLAGTE